MADGFLLNLDPFVLTGIQVLEEVGGWNEVLDRFESDRAPACQSRPAERPGSGRIVGKRNLSLSVEAARPFARGWPLVARNPLGIALAGPGCPKSYLEPRG